MSTRTMRTCPYRSIVPIDVNDRKERTMAERIDEAKVREEVERFLPALLEKSEDELRAEVGQLAIGQDLLNPETTTTFEALVEAGDQVVERRTVRDIVCDPANQEKIDEYLTVDNVKGLVMILLGALRIELALTVSAIALAVLLLRIGLHEYCRTATGQGTP